MKLITFDFWNTLFLDRDEGLRNEKRISFTLDLLSRRCSDLTRPAIEEGFRYAAQQFEDQWSSLTASTMGHYVQNLCSRLQLAVPAAECQRLVEFYETILLEHPPMLIEGAAEAIRYAARHLKVGLISDTGYSPGTTLRKILRSHGLEDFFHSFSFSNETGYLKPSRQCYEKILRHLGVEPAHAVHIGDLEHTDVKGAKDLGMKAIKYIGSNPSANAESIADLVIQDLRDFPEALERLM